MKHSNGFARPTLLGTLSLGALLLLAGGAPGAGAQEVSTSYKGTKRDPFVKYKPPLKPRKAEKSAPGPISPPDVQARIEQYKARKLAALNLQQPAPKPTTALLLSEVQVTGIFRTPRGYAAMVYATPIKLSYVVYPGESFYDGMLVAIEEARLVCRREVRWTDGRREVMVETKGLRQPNAVQDSLTASAPAPDGGAGGPAAGGAGYKPSAPVRTDSDASAGKAEAPKGDGTGYWANRDKMHALAQRCPNGGAFKADGTVVCN